MQPKKKRPTRFLWILPIMLILDIVILSVTVYLDSHTAAGEAQLPVESLPFLTAATAVYLAAANAAGALTAVLLTIIAAVSEKTKKQEGEHHENNQYRD